jgi:hypothetical protein
MKKRFINIGTTRFLSRRNLWLFAGVTGRMFPGGFVGMLFAVMDQRTGIDSTPLTHFALKK